MCEEAESEGGRSEERFFVVDHANKLGDRERPNPNGGLLSRLRTELFDPVVRPVADQRQDEPDDDGNA